MKTNMSKYILVHSGKRDGYQIAKALYDADILQVFVTDDYVLRYLFSKERFLPLKYVCTSYKALFWSMLYKLTKLQHFQVKKDKALSVLSAKKANEESCDLFAYSYYGLPAFKLLRKTQKRILFQLHPHPAYIRGLFLDEIEHLPASRTSLEQEHELKGDDKHFDLLSKEAKYADKIYCASSFTKYTLEVSGIINDKIKVVPYGVDLKSFPYFDRNRQKATTINVLFVGSLNQRKGVFYLLEAIDLLQQAGIPVTLEIIGRGIFDEELLALFDIKQIKIGQNVSFESLIEAYKNADVFVLPSLCEGFGQVILEAMATGLPIITTEHTSGPDLIENGKEGFVLPIRDSQSIVDKIEYMFRNPLIRQNMGRAAYAKSRQFSWGRFSSILIENLHE